MHTIDSQGFHAVRKSRIAKGIIDQVRDLIASHRLKPGDRLPSERALAAALGVGRSTLREAIRSLESLGLVEVRPGEGTFLTDPTTAQTSDPLSASLFREWSAQAKLLEVRGVLEPGLARLAARRATPARIEELRAVLVEQERGLRRGESHVEQGTAFHSLIAETTGNELLRRIIGSVMLLVRQAREASWRRRGRPARSLAQHRGILEAIEARNGALAERRMRQHIRTLEILLFPGQEERADGPA